MHYLQIRFCKKYFIERLKLSFLSFISQRFISFFLFEKLVGDSSFGCFFTIRNVVAERSCFYTCLSFCSWGVSGRYPLTLGQTPPGQTPPGQTPPPRKETATAADGTHPTGMPSCNFSCFCSIRVCCVFKLLCN